MPMPWTYRQATREWRAFLAEARAAMDLETDNVTYTAVEGVLRAFRRRLTPQQAIDFAQVLPSVLRALFVEHKPIACLPDRVLDHVSHFNFAFAFAAEMQAHCLLLRIVRKRQRLQSTSEFVLDDGVREAETLDLAELHGAHAFGAPEIQNPHTHRRAILRRHLLLFDADAPELAVSRQLIFGIAVASAGAFMGLVWLAARARKRPVVTGVEELVGQVAVALADFDGRGQVRIRGEIWQAASRVPVRGGQSVRVLALDGLVLDVAPL